MDQTLGLTADEVKARREALGWSQNELARRIKKNPGYVSGVLTGKWVSGVVWGRIAKVLAREEARREAKRVTAAEPAMASGDGRR